MIRWKLVFLRILHIFLLFTCTRILHLFYNWNMYAQAELDELARVFWLGARFDISAILLIGAPFYLLWFFPLAKTVKGYRFESFTETVYIIWAFIFIGFNVGDTEYVHFNGRRLSRAMYRMKDDMNDQAAQLAVHYWYLVIVGLIFLGLFIYFFPRRRGNYMSVSWRVACLGTFLFLLVGTLGVRGGFQRKPLRENHAFVFEDSNLGTLALNTAFTLIHSKTHEPVKYLKWVSESEMNQVIEPALPSRYHGELEWHNVVIIILESFALEYMGDVNNRVGYTPFLDKLATESLFFTKHFANGRRSVEAVPAILASFPSLLPEPFLFSNLQHVQVLGMPQLLKSKNYRSYFFHGAKNGSMFFDSFCDRIGVDEYHGRSEYPYPDRDFDGNWGIYDEPFFLYSIDVLSEAQKPFLATIFSLSSHQPYSVPKKYTGKFPKGTLEIHESIGYTDYALKKFFEAAQKQSWYSNTLFVITGDHTQKSEDPYYAGDIGPYRVPLLFYHPLKKLPKVSTNLIAQHTDILPSIIDLLGVKARTQLGRSLFQDSKKFAVNRLAGAYSYTDNKKHLNFSFDGQLKSYKHQDFQNLVEVPPEEVSVELLRLKSYIQFVHNGVVTNSLVESSK